MNSQTFCTGGTPVLCFGGPLDGQTVEYAGPYWGHTVPPVLRWATASISCQTPDGVRQTTGYRVELFTTRQGVWDVYVHGDRPSAEDVIRKVQAANRETP